MEMNRRVVLAVVLLLVLLAGGTVGYMRLEGWSMHDALYMSVITLSTVGYREVGTLSVAGEWFTIAYIFFSITLVGFAVATITAFLIQGELRDLVKGRRMQKQIEKLEDHYILCGCGAVGRAIVTEFLHAEVDFIVVEQNPEETEIPRDQAVLFIEGDATEEEVLQLAGITRAKGLIAALHSDPQNVFLTLSARQLNPKLQIVARANEKGTAGKLLRAGADRVISPFEIAGRRMASTVLRPNVLNFLEVATYGGGADMRLEEIHLQEPSELVGKSLRETDLGKKTRAMIVGISNSDGTSRQRSDSSVPLAGMELRAGDILIALGSDEQIRVLKEVCRGSA